MSDSGCSDYGSGASVAGSARSKSQSPAVADCRAAQPDDSSDGDIKYTYRSDPLQGVLGRERERIGKASGPQCLFSSERPRRSVTTKGNLSQTTGVEKNEFNRLRFFRCVPAAALVWISGLSKRRRRSQAQRNLTWSAPEMSVRGGRQ
jgi:hypothetical protein